MPWEQQTGNSLVIREPVSVVGSITPWNCPIRQTVAKFALALTADSTVGLRPDEMTPLVDYPLAELIEASGLRVGVLNMVTGTGPIVDEVIMGKGSAPS